MFLQRIYIMEDLQYCSSLLTMLMHSIILQLAYSYYYDTNMSLLKDVIQAQENQVITSLLDYFPHNERQTSFQEDASMLPVHPTNINIVILYT